MASEVVSLARYLPLFTMHRQENHRNNQFI